MKLFPVHPLFWFTLLVLWASQSETEANSPDVCEDEKILGEFSSSVPGHNVEEDSLDENFLCLFYPTNILNCSWSFPTLQRETQLFVDISICNGKRTVKSLNHSCEERVGSRSLPVCEREMSHVILQFNMTLHDKWTVYFYVYEMDTLEVLSPPPNISASIKDGGLSVTWGQPRSRVGSQNSECFEYQLDLGDQKRPKHLTKKQFHMEPNADPSHTYKVRIRTRKVDECQDNSQWSDWSHIVKVEPSVYQFSIPVVVSISLGIPMILLAVLLLVRHQRVSKLLFPPIPRPPQKYKCFLEKNDQFTLFSPALSAEPVEEITEVQDTEQKPGKMI